MITFLLVLQIICAIALVACILLQPSKGGGGLVLSSGNTNMGGGSKDYHPLFKPTFFLAGLLLFSCLLMGWLKLSEKGESNLDAASSNIPSQTINIQAETPTTNGDASTEKSSEETK